MLPDGVEVEVDAKRFAHVRQTDRMPDCRSDASTASGKEDLPQLSQERDPKWKHVLSISSNYSCLLSYLGIHSERDPLITTSVRLNTTYSLPTVPINYRNEELLADPKDNHVIHARNFEGIALWAKTPSVPK